MSFVAVRMSMILSTEEFQRSRQTWMHLKPSEKQKSREEQSFLILKDKPDI